MKNPILVRLLDNTAVAGVLNSIDKAGFFVLDNAGYVDYDSLPAVLEGKITNRVPVGSIGINPSLVRDYFGLEHVLIVSKKLAETPQKVKKSKS